MAKRIFAIDPGPERSAYAFYDIETGELIAKDYTANHAVLALVHYLAEKHAIPSTPPEPLPDVLLCEMPESYGNVVSDSIFQTAFWAGRFIEAWSWGGGRHALLKRKEVTLQLCGKRNVGDPEVQYALRIRFNEPANNRLRPKGKLKGVSGDIWAALGVAIAWAEKNNLRSARPAAWRK